MIVVPNGCTDRTDQVAEAVLAECIRPLTNVTARVEVLQRGGKTNAWNELIHRLADPGSDQFILMDADILLLTPDTLELLSRTLTSQPHAHVTTDQPVKHIARKPKHTLKERILLGAGGMTQTAPGQLTGQLYCARASILRQIWIPLGIIVEDGYLKQMLCTDGFAQPLDNSRIVRAEGASHEFECYTRLIDIWNHQIRQAAGHTIYTFLTACIRQEMAERPVFNEIARRCSANPEWFGDVARAEIRRRGFWVMDRPSFWIRWRRLKLARGLAARLRFFALALVATPFDICVFVVANHRLKSGRIGNLWKDTRTTTLK